MPDPAQDRDNWITDAREHGFPVMVTGVVLLVALLGLPVMAAWALVLLPMFAVQLCLARRAFPMPDEDADDW